MAVAEVEARPVAATMARVLMWTNRAASNGRTLMAELEVDPAADIDTLAGEQTYLLVCLVEGAAEKIECGECWIDKVVTKTDTADNNTVHTRATLKWDSSQFKVAKLMNDLVGQIVRAEFVEVQVTAFGARV